MSVEVEGWNDGASVLIVADLQSKREAAEHAAQSVNGRVVGVERAATALDRLAGQAVVDVVLLELEGTAALDRDALLDWANGAARDGLTTPIISLPASLIDEVMARIVETRVHLLCDPTEEDRAAQLGLQFARRRQRLHDGSAQSEAERLRRMSEEVARIAVALAEMSTDAEAGGSYAPLADHPRPANLDRVDAEQVRAIIRVRRLREQFFPRGLFSDPAWDMLLDLFAAKLEKSRVAVSSLCIAAAVPATTALRWIRTLTENGLFVREEDPEDGRRVFIALSDSAEQALTAYFSMGYQMGFRWPEG